MRFSELRLIKYGKFDGATLAFPAATTDFHMIVGPNEAGKSTTLSAVGDFLFGFPHSTTFDFRFDRQLLRIGAAIDHGGELLSFRRRKGNGQTLLDDQEQPVDEGRLISMLGGQSRDNFQRMFSLDHGRLRRGGQAILDAEDDVGKAIFAAGSGLVGVSRLADDLDEEAKAIWTSRANSSRAYYVAHNAAEEARSRLRAAQVRPAQWEERRKQAEGTLGDLEERRKARAQVQGELQQVERRRRVLAPIAQLRSARSSFSELGDVALLPADAGQTVVEVRQVLAATSSQIHLATSQAQTARDQLDAIAIAPELIEQRDTIDELRQEVGAVDKSLADLPKRRVEQRACDERLRGLLDEIGWPQEDAAAVRARLPGRPAIAELRNLLEALSGVEARRESARVAIGRRSDELSALQGQLGALPVNRDLSGISGAVRFARAAGDLDRRMADAEVQLAAASKALTNALSQLSPWAGSVDQLQQLSLPTPAEAAHLGSAISQAEGQLASLRSDLSRLQDQAAQLELQRSQMMRDDQAVSADEVSIIRQRRDGIWGAIKGAVLGDGSVENPLESVQQYEVATQAADAVADRRFDKAELSGRLLEASKRLEHLNLETGQVQVRVTAAEAVVASAIKAWSAATTMVVPGITPIAFEAWRDRRERALLTVEGVRTAERVLEGVVAERDRVRSRLQTALAAVDAAPLVRDADAPVSLLVEEAERLEQKAAAEEQRRNTLEAQIVSARDGHEQAEVERQSADEAHQAWLSGWAPAVTAVGLDPNAAASKIRASLEILDQIRTEIESVLRFQERIDGMEADIKAFGERVAGLADQCGLADAAEQGAQLLQRLVAAADEASTLKERQGGLQKQLADAENRLSVARAEAASAEARLHPLQSAAQVEGEVELDRVIAQSDRARQLSSEIEALAKEIVGLGDGLSLDELVQDTEASDAIVLKGQADALSDQLDELNATIERLSAECSAAEAAFRALDDGPDAAVAAADLAQARSEMEFQAEAYVQKRAEASLLRWTIDRYRRERQAPLLGRASELFSTLTLDRYSRLTVEMDSGKPQLSAITTDGLDVIPIGGLSEGTIDQLYLSLRIAAVEDAIESGLKLPFLADDLFINFDDARSEAGFRVLGQLAAKTQVLFFTHHDHLLPVAQRALPNGQVSRCEIA